MLFSLTLQNYRCFGDKPSTLNVDYGFTALIGPNNHGKSTVLRSLYEMRPAFVLLQSNFSNLYNNHIKNQIAIRPSFPTANGASDLFHNLNNRNAIVTLESLDSTRFPSLEGVKISFEIRRSDSQTLISFSKNDNPIRSNAREQAGVVSFEDGGSITISELREMSRLITDSLYIPSSRYVEGSAGSKHYDINTGSSFVSKWKQHKTGADKVLNERSEQISVCIQEILGFHSFVINPSEQGDTLQLIIDGRSYRLNEVGSGIAQLITTLVHVGVSQPSITLIDEPELGLHPSLQTKFMLSLANYCKEGVVFSTHSIGLARTLAPQIYSVMKNDTSTSRIKEFNAHSSLSELLGSLHYSGQMAIGYKAVLLVEGKHDVATFQELLRARGLDHLCVLLPLNGETGINADAEALLAEIRRISDCIYCIIDSERVSADVALDANRTAFANVCDKLNIKCHVLERRAIENYFPEAAIQEVAGEAAKAMGPFETTSDIPNFWGKARNWKIARAMNVTDLDETDLGSFILNMTKELE